MSLFGGEFQHVAAKEHPDYRPALLDSFSDKDPTASKGFAATWAARGRLDKARTDHAGSFDADRVKGVMTWFWSKFGP